MTQDSNQIERNRLNAQTLEVLSSALQKPRYDRTSKRVGIVHLGIGAFHRAHQALYTDDAMAQLGGDWLIAGVSLRSASIRDALAPQQGLYSVGIRANDSAVRRVVGAVDRVLVAPEDPEAVIALLSAPHVHVVTLTITEKGYCLNAATGQVDFDHPDIRHDLMHPDQPRSAIGFLAAALVRRAKAHLPINIISCENLSENGPKLRAAVMEFLDQTSTGINDWVADHVAFPATMVDRIVPATTDDDLEEAERALGVRDEAAVKTEAFSQWVIEDQFTAPRPAWEQVGALVVPNVLPYEHLKLRLLNGPHSAIAYIGALAGYDFVHQVMEQPVLRRYIGDLMTLEIAPEVEIPEGFDVSAYINDLQARFSNAALNHRTLQIAMDGSQKLPQRILPVIERRLARGQSVIGLSLAVAAWMCFVGERHYLAQVFDLSDPLADTLRSPTPDASAEALVDRLLAIESIFSRPLAESDVFRATLIAGVEQLSMSPVIDVLADALVD